MSKDFEKVLLQLIKRPLEHLGDEVDTRWTILRQSNEEVLKYQCVLVLSDFTSELFSVDSCGQQDGLSDECLE